MEEAFKVGGVVCHLENQTSMPAPENSDGRAGDTGFRESVRQQPPTPMCQERRMTVDKIIKSLTC